MGTSRLQLYNAALAICTERQLAALTENREPRRLLDNAWNNNAVQNCFEGGQWKFAMRTMRLDYDLSVTPQFGYHRAFLKPIDWCATSAVCDDEYFNSPLTRYMDEAGYWYADVDLLYVRFVSNDVNYGMNLGMWPSRFADYVAAHLARLIIGGLTTDEKRQFKVEKYEEKMLLEAKNHDAMSDSTMFPAQGMWSRSRQGRSPSRRDRGSRGNLIG